MNLRCMADQQPWASLLVAGVKDVENRNSAMPATLVGQWCAIYASRTLAPVGSWVQAEWNARATNADWPWVHHLKTARKQCVRGAIVGLVKWDNSYPPGFGFHSFRSWEKWRDKSAHGWVYSDRIALANPVPLLEGGYQSLTWRLSDEITEQVWEASGFDKRLASLRRDSYAIDLRNAVI